MSKSKRELREQRRAAERAAAITDSRRRRIRRLLGATGIAAVLVAVAVAVSASGGSAKPVAARGAAKVVAGIQEKDGVLGDPNAPITLTEYLDPQCPICAEASKQTLPTVIEKYVRSGKVKLQARTLSFIGPDSVRAAKVAAGAKQQGKEWAFLETFYASQGTENSGYVTDDFLTDVAEGRGRRRQAGAQVRGQRRRAPVARPGRRGGRGAEGRLDAELHRQARRRRRDRRRRRARGPPGQARQGALVMLRAASIVVGVVGLAIATYLTVVHYAGGSPVCAIAHGCATVQKSDYASLAGIPVALLGVIGYLGILALAGP